jgi:hypothetical protein
MKSRSAGKPEDRSTADALEEAVPRKISLCGNSVPLQTTIYSRARSAGADTIEIGAKASLIERVINSYH